MRAKNCFDANSNDRRFRDQPRSFYTRLNARGIQRDEGVGTVELRSKSRGSLPSFDSSSFLLLFLYVCVSSGRQDVRIRERWSDCYANEANCRMNVLREIDCLRGETKLERARKRGRFERSDNGEVQIFYFSLSWNIRIL